MKNLRIPTRSPRAHSDDFEWLWSETPNNRHPNERKWKKYKSKLKDFDFGIVYWGAIGQIREVDPEASSTVIYIKDLTENKYVKEVMQSIDWHSLPCEFVGAPHLSPEQIIEAYEEHKTKV